jgi:dihydrofolate reductase
LSREKDLEVGGAHVFGTFEEAIVFAAQCPGGEETFVIGGGEIYAMSLPYVTRLYLTLVHLDVPGDTFFPPYKEDFTRVIDMLFEEHKGIKFTYVTLER